MKRIPASLLIFSCALGALHAEDPGSSTTPVTTTVDASENAQASSLSTRRTMLQWHQAAGLLTLGLWLATNLAGERAYDAYPALGRLVNEENQSTVLFLLLQDQQRFQTVQPLLLMQLTAYDRFEKRVTAHRGLAQATWGMYALTAGLSLFAPKRYSEADRGGIDSIFIHRALAIVHAAAMLRLAYLGPRMEKGGAGAVRQMKDTGWAGFAALGASFVVMAF